MARDGSSGPMPGFSCGTLSARPSVCWCFWHGLMELTLEPYLAELLGKGYIVWPIFVYGVTVSLFAYSAVGVFLPAVISLWGDIRLRSNRLRRTMAVLGLLFLSHYVLWASVLLLGNTWYPILRDWFYWLLNLPFARNGTLFLSGCLLFLSLNK